MDNIISAAIEEVCVRGASGIHLLELWPSLQEVVSSSGFELSDTVKKAIWLRLASHPGLQFVISCSSEEQKDILQRHVEDLEKIGLIIVAEEHLRDSFMGLYDLKQAPHFEISQIQRRVLERLAMARSSGITQNELAKEFDIKGSNFFYVVKNLECQQLIVRQTTMVREKESVNVKKGPKGDHIVNTNLLRLSRFAKDANLHPQQRIEITRSVWPEILDEFGDTVPCISPFEGSEDCLKEDVHINDYIPAMKAICEKLEASKNKVDFVSGIKSALGYRKTTGHRAWRSILYRLKYSGLVEEFQAEVKGKDVTCLRLLKKFDPKYFQPKVYMHRYNGTNSENLVKGIKRGQITDQLVEIPLEHQIYDMIDATGKKGITILELSTRLGINLKKLHKRVFSMREKYGVVSESEIHNKTQVYRFWTNSLYHNGLSKNTSHNQNLLPDGNGLSSQLGALVPYECPVDSISKGELLALEQTYSGQALETHNPCCGPTSEVLEGEQELNDRAHKSNIVRDRDIKFGAANSASELQDTLSSSHPSVSVSSMPILPTKKYACRSSTVFAAQREQRILEKLEKEKFLLKVELHKWLEDIEKDKPTTMDRKTLDRSLKRLQDVGSCVCIGVHMPSLTNFSSLRYAEAILHPSVNPSQELIQHIYERQRTFDIQSRRSSGSARLKPEQPVVELPVLNDVKRVPTHVDDMPALKALIANGFVLAKMVRVKLLHKFLWSYLHSSPHLQNSLISFKNPGYNDEGSGQQFSIDAAIKEMPLELFLQIAGSRLIINNLEKNCKLGLKLSDFPIQERRFLLDAQATSRLSSIIEILHRLRLIQLVNKGAVQDVNLLSYALELHPYLEEPLPAVLPSSNINRSDNCYKLRHDFILSDKEAVDRYWETLEYCFAAADPAYSRQCFPGNAVQEVFLSRSWASVRVMSIEQRMKLLKRITSSDQKKKISFSECVKISRELNLTLEQVLRFSYDKRQARLIEGSYLKSERWGQSENTKIVGVVSTKRRRLSTDASNNFPQTLSDAGELIGATEITSSDIDEQALQLNYCSPSEGENAGLLQLCMAGEQFDAVVHPQPHEEGSETAAFISQCSFDGLKSTRKRRFSWTDSSDRQLIMQYARHHAMLGANFFRVEWPLLRHLPANHNACKKRIHALNKNPNIKRAILRLCGLLGERYTCYLDNSRIKANQEAVDVDFEQSNKDIILYKTVQNQSTSLINICKSNSHHYCWDDFEDSDIKLALDEVLKCKKLPKMMVGCKLQQGWTNNSSTGNLICSHESEQYGASSCAGDVVHKFDKKDPDSTAFTCTNVQNRPNTNSSRGKFLKFRRKIKTSEICKSLPIANAIELLKLVFLSCSKTPGVQNSLAKTLQKYHHGDIFAAFSYLNENNYLVSGHGTQPFVLSRKFLHNICSSPFPNDSGKRATIFSDWLQKQQNDLIHDGVAIAPDLQCGDIFHLSSLVFSGEISVSPSLPSTGFDGADEFKSSVFSLLRDMDDIYISKNSKRKVDEPCSIEKVKKPKLPSKADGDRKEKGFPDIKVFLKMGSVSGTDALERLGYGKIHIASFEGETTSVKDAYCLASSLDYVVVHHDDSPPSSWDAMPRYFEMRASASFIKNEAKPSPTDFKSVHLIINQAGEQGLNMDEISEALKIKGEGVADMFVETLEAFRLTVKVNAFDSIRVVDASFISKYFISVLENDKIQNQGYDVLSCTRPQGLSVVPSKGISSLQLDNTDDSQIEARVGLYSGNKTSDIGTPSVFRPILPWVNGDGSTNVNVYRGLSRRIIGIVMQNPYILEEDIIAKMDVLTPQSCRRLLETMLHDNHFRVRWTHQTSSSASPPSLLQNLLPSNLRKPAIKLQKHYFANPMSTRML